MKDLEKALPHLLTALAVIIALVVLAVDHIIAGGEAYGGILMAGGFTLGGTVASTSISSAATAAVDVSHSGLTQTPIPTQTFSKRSPTATMTPDLTVTQTVPEQSTHPVQGSNYPASPPAGTPPTA